ncbi:MAG: TIGR04283 family arsenosugar biosynthesis glycosyltransferase [Gammaproteobacteria bacterium]|nr:TIGR04283 family arsenosugar biosynthesis glycosyltransferase [Gammaproteobacteria bacterium]MCP5458860.1 TIGR04283 family arsenosugar biosynthesis glycosyltransferase [Gammaproteobacteria bacterium]
MAAVSIIVPVLNEASVLVNFLENLQNLRCRECEVLVVDGGSHDASREIAMPLADRVLTSAKGRAEQMNTGAREAGGDILWFLHSDSVPPPNVDRLIIDSFRQSDRAWGRFDVRLSGTHPLLRLIGMMMNIRSRLTGIATGDQGIFVRRAAFEQVGGYANIPLMEDIALSRSLKRISRPICLRTRLIASSRRWEKEGIHKTILIMWSLRLAYFLGVDPKRLARVYYGA